MRDDIRLKTCLIIRRNGEYLVGRVIGTNVLRWSNSPYDAWRTRERQTAERIARITGGVTILWNPIVKQMKVM